MKMRPHSELVHVVLSRAPGWMRVGAAGATLPGSRKLLVSSPDLWDSLRGRDAAGCCGGRGRTPLPWRRRGLLDPPRGGQQVALRGCDGRLRASHRRGPLLAETVGGPGRSPNVHPSLGALFRRVSTPNPFFLPVQSLRSAGLGETIGRSEALRTN